jgi:hypothetical protein
VLKRDQIIKELEAENKQLREDKNYALKVSIQQGLGDKEIVINEEQILLLLGKAIKNKEINLTGRTLLSVGKLGNPGLTIELETGTIINKFEKDASLPKLTKIQGILTSNIRSRTSTDVPYMAFFRLKYSDREIAHSDAELCANAKCKDCEIPVIFR